MAAITAALFILIFSLFIANSPPWWYLILDQLGLLFSISAFLGIVWTDYISKKIKK